MGYVLARGVNGVAKAFKKALAHIPCPCLVYPGRIRPFVPTRRLRFGIAAGAGPARADASYLVQSSITLLKSKEAGTTAAGQKCTRWLVKSASSGF